MTTEFRAVPVVEPNSQGIQTTEPTTWRSMCLVADKEAVMYITTFATIAGVIIFCCYQLTHLTDCHSQNAYIGLLGTTLGVMIPSPFMRTH